MKAKNNYTYDVVFHSETTSMNNGFKATFDYCLDYIREHNGTNWGYFEDYKRKGGNVGIFCRETGREVYMEVVKQDIHEATTIITD